MAKHEWTQWYKFSDVFQHHGWITDNSQSRFMITINNQTGRLHSDGGFRLKSLPLQGSLSRYHNPADVSTCPLKKGDLGLYWIHIESSNGIESKDYIGMSNEFTAGIMKRLIDHFQKISVLPSRPNINNYIGNLEQVVELDGDINMGTYESIDDVRSAFQIEEGGRDRKWKETHRQYMNKGVDLYNTFNDDLISLCFYKMGQSEQVDPADEQDLKYTIEQAEAWAHLNFEKETRSLLSLNVRYEGDKYEGSTSLLMQGFNDRLKEKYDRKMPIDIFKRKVERLSDHAQTIFEYLESRGYEEVSSDLLMHIISNGQDMRLSAPPYNASGTAVRRLGDGETRRNIMVLIPKIREKTFLVRTYLESNDLRSIVNNVEETPEYESSMNSEFMLDENVTVHLFKKVMLDTINKWKRESL